MSSRRSQAHDGYGHSTPTTPVYVGAPSADDDLEYSPQSPPFPRYSPQSDDDEESIGAAGPPSISDQLRSIAYYMNQLASRIESGQISTAEARILIDEIGSQLVESVRD